MPQSNLLSLTILRTYSIVLVSLLQTSSIKEAQSNTLNSKIYYISTRDPDVSVLLIDSSKCHGNFIQFTNSRFNFMKKRQFIKPKQAPMPHWTTSFRISSKLPYFSNNHNEFFFLKAENESKTIENEIWIPSFQLSVRNTDFPEVSSFCKPEHKIESVRPLSHLSAI